MDKLDLIHYNKINIFGESFVGKSSLISLMENFSNDDFIIEFDNNKLNEAQIFLDMEKSLVEQIKRIKILLNGEEGIYMYLNLYETNLFQYDYIKSNLDTLLFQTECIIIMFDDNETFENIPNLISTIKMITKENYFREVPIFLIQNKMDLKAENTKETINDINESIKKILEENKDIIYREISLI